MKYFLFTIILVLSSLGFSKELPELNRTVVDPYGYVTQDQKNKIDLMIRDYFNKTKVQIGVVVIDSLEGDNLENYSIRLFDKWKLGSEKNDDGLLFLYVVKDRKMRTEVGQGLEGLMTDVESKRIQSFIKNELRSGDYGGAIIKQLTLTIHEMEFNRGRDQQPQPSKIEPIEISKETWHTIFGIALILLSVVLLITGINTYSSYQKEKQEIPALTQKVKKLSDFISSYKELVEVTSKYVKKVSDLYQDSFLKKVNQIEKEIDNYDQSISQKEKEIEFIKTIVHNYKKKG